MDSNLLSTKNGLFSFSDYSVDDLCDLGQSEPENLAAASCLLHILLKQLNSVSSWFLGGFFVHLWSLFLKLKTFFKEKTISEKHHRGKILSIICIILYRQAKDRLLLWKDKPGKRRFHNIESKWSWRDQRMKRTNIFSGVWKLVIQSY